MENTPNISNQEKNKDNITKLNFKDGKYATGRRKKSVARIWLKKGSGNILILTSHVEKSGLELYKIINENAKNKDVFFIYGETDQQLREEVRWYAEEHDNVVIIATYQVFSTGVNIKNLQTILFAIAGKSKIRNLQSI